MTKGGTIIVSPFYTGGNWVFYPSYPARKWWRQEPCFHSLRQAPPLLSLSSQPPPSLSPASLSSPSPFSLPGWPPFLPFVHSLLLLKTNLQTRTIVRVYCTSFWGNGTLGRISKEESPKVYRLGRGFQVSRHNSAYLDSCLGLSSPRPGSPIHNLIPENPISITSVSQKSRENILRSHSRTAALGTAKHRSHSLSENPPPPIIMETGNVSPQSCHGHSGAGRLSSFPKMYKLIQGRVPMLS